MTPTLEDLASETLTHRFGDIFNPPALTNFLGAAQAAIDITAIRNLNFPPFACSDSFPPITWSDSVTGGLFVDGRYFASTGCPITYRWRPDRIERSAELGGLRLHSQTVLAVGKRAALVRLRVDNVSGSARHVALRLGLKSTVTHNSWDWAKPIAPAEFDNELEIDEQRRALIFKARHSEAVCMQGATPAPVAVSSNGIDFEDRLATGRSLTLTYINVVDATVEGARAIFDALAADPDGEIDRAEREWSAEIAAAFTPGNGRFSGSLPRLESADADLRRLYLLGTIATLYLKRELPGVDGGRVYTTLMPRYWQTCTWIWDYQLGSTVNVLLDPAVTRRLLDTWTSVDVHTFMATEWLSGRGVGSWYAANDHAMMTLVHDYVRWTGDRDWLASTVNAVDGSERRIVDRVHEYACRWELYRGAKGLADYGGLENLLECVRAYSHEVAGLNAANVYNLRIAAELFDSLGRRDDAKAMRDAAERLLPEVLKLYVEGEGCWAARRPDGTLVPVRHAFDLATVLNTISADLSPRQCGEMVRLFCDELQTPGWMHALSPRDADAIFDVRPDHQWTGSYPAWPAQMVSGLYRIGECKLASRWLKGIARTGRQGPFGQAHFVESVIEPELGGARKAPSDFPFLTDWCCSGGAAWGRTIIESLFGIDAGVERGLTATPRLAEIDPQARLVNLAYQGALYTIDARGPHLQDGPA